MPSPTTETMLLDANVLIALSVEDHEHHHRARRWLGTSRTFATTPSTQGSLLRYVVRVSSAQHAADALELLAVNPRHEFWPDARPYDVEMLRGVIGHRQVTDAYLAAAASHRRARLATFDRGLVQLRPVDVELID